MSSKLNRNTLAIYIASFLSYQIFITAIILASLYAAFPDVSPNLVILMYSAPSLVSALLSLVMGTFIAKANKKLMLLTGMALIVIGGAAIVFTNGGSFALCLVSAILIGAGYAVITTTANVLLIENNAPEDAPKAIATNAAIGCLGNIILMFLAGVLAQSNWTHAYYLCFPVIISLVIVAVLYKNPEKNAAAAAGADAAAWAEAAQAQPAQKYIGLFSLVIVAFVLVNFCTTAWNTNYSSYVIAEKQIGTTVETGLISTLASVGGVVGGFFVAGPFIKALKNMAAPVAMLLVALPCIMGGLGVNSIVVLYIAAFAFMVFYQVVYSVMISTAGKLFPGGAGVSICQGVLGIGAFFAPYILSFCAAPFGGTMTAKFWAGVIFILIAIVISIPVLKQAADK